MNKKTLGGLIVLNLALIVTLTLLAFSPRQAEAQLGAQRAGDYIMVAGTVNGVVPSVVYITDLNNAVMLAVGYDQGSKTVKTFGFRAIEPDFAGGGAGGARPRSR